MEGKNSFAIGMLRLLIYLEAPSSMVRPSNHPWYAPAPVSFDKHCGTFPSTLSRLVREAAKVTDRVAYHVDGNPESESVVVMIMCLRE